ncbi:hypothetical protein GCM10011600_14760 [Pseudolysinimonas yzui]|uniref:TIR domain-containing protein n=1 Tax=Pseudolysinimonas yzui TaxID=2708254 RepID=A0A8J3GQ54_9MICO|nr:hypothetical protein GCM10011600_14760 [Pseudolysinimonas yzui]
MLAEVLNGVECFVSSKDIAKGARGLNVIAENLNNSDFGLVVVTRANLGSSWINFEAGALGRTLGHEKVSPLLLDLPEGDVKGPLSQFQMTTLTDKEDVWQLVSDLNAHIDLAIPEGPRRTLYEAAWPTLETAVTEALNYKPVKAKRAPEDTMEEVLLAVRELSNRGSKRQAFSEIRDALEEHIGVAFSLKFVQVHGGLVLSIRVADKGRPLEDLPIDVEGLRGVAIDWAWTFYLSPKSDAWDGISIYEE